MIMFKLYPGTYYGVNRQKTFAKCWEDVDSFKADYESCGIEKTISDSSVTNLYYLLYASYGNSTIRSSDINRFKYALFSRVYSYGPTWEKRLEIQKNLRGLTEKDLLNGGLAIYNTADNPGTDPTDTSLTELPYINRQNTSRNIKSKLNAYNDLWQMLKVDVTSEFIKGFKPLFKQVATKELPLIYKTEVEE